MRRKPIGEGFGYLEGEEGKEVGKFLRELQFGRRRNRAHMRPSCAWVESVSSSICTWPSSTRPQNKGRETGAGQGEGGSPWGGCCAFRGCPGRVDPRALPPEGLGLGTGSPCLLSGPPESRGVDLGPMLKVLLTLNNSGLNCRSPLIYGSWCQF